MKILKKSPTVNGAYPAIQEWAGITAPEGYYGWPDTLSTADFYAHNGFVVLTVKRGIVASYEPNMEAWEAWKATLPPEPEPKPTDTEVLNAILGVTE